MNNILGFYAPDQENGYLSNWYSCSFKYGRYTYSSAEQFMMAQNHRSLLPEEGWPVPLPQYRQEELQRVPQRRYGQAEEVFLCASAHPGLPLDSGEANATAHAVLHAGRRLP